MRQQGKELGLPQDLTPIGVVKNGLKEPHWEEWAEVESEILIREDLSEALEGLEEFSHILVLFWMHRLPIRERSLFKVHPRGRLDLPLVGVFATRAPARPNPIGVTTVRLLERQGSVLRVKGLDAIDGTPVLDIKPHIPDHPAAKVKVPLWVKKL